MNKSSNPNRLRRIATTAAGFVVSVIGICAAAPSAFAMRVVEPDSTASTVHHSGTPSWEIALIVVVAVAVIGLSLLAAVRSHKASRPQDTALAGRRTASTGSPSRAAS